MALGALPRLCRPERGRSFTEAANEAKGGRPLMGVKGMGRRSKSGGGRRSNNDTTMYKSLSVSGWYTLAPSPPPRCSRTLNQSKP